MLSDLSPDARALANFMSDLSEQIWCAGWLKGLEFMLWPVVIGEKVQEDIELTEETLT